MKLVIQGKYECAAAALAMLLDKELFFVKRAMGKAGWRNDDSGASDKIMAEAAYHFGYVIKRVRPEKVIETGTPCILTVPSLNYEGRWHAVAWDGKRILDPNNGRPARNFWPIETDPKTMGAKTALVIVGFKSRSA